MAQPRRLAPNVLELTLLLWLGAVVAGLVGALTGLGGGIVIVPMLTLLFKVDMRYAIGGLIPTSALAVVFGLYLNRGYIDPVLAMPVMLGCSWARSRGADCSSPRRRRCSGRCLVS